jgi:hypothetical protein
MYSSIPTYLASNGFAMGSREYRLADAAMRLRVQVAAAGAGGVCSDTVCFDTLTTVIDRVLQSPTEAKFRRLRLGNKLFQSRVGQYPPALDLLRAVGFEEREEGGAQVLLLQARRQDPGLMWLAKGLLEQHRPTD